MLRRFMCWMGAHRFEFTVTYLNGWMFHECRCGARRRPS